MPGLRRLAPTLLLGLPLMLVPAAPAVAAPPDHYTFEVDDTGVSRTSKDCGFDIIVHSEGTVRVVDFRDGDGTIGRTLVTYPSLTYTFTNAATGASVTSRSPDAEHLTWNADGSFTLKVTGLVLHWLVPGQGISGQAGSFTIAFDTDGDETTIAQVGLDEDYHAALCEILSP